MIVNYCSLLLFVLLIEFFCIANSFTSPATTTISTKSRRRILSSKSYHHQSLTHKQLFLLPSDSSPFRVRIRNTKLQSDDNKVDITTTSNNNNNNNNNDHDELLVRQQPNRRETFGAMVGSILLPTTTTILSATSAPQPVLAQDGDDYPFKKVVKKIADVFSEALPNADLIRKVTKRLDRFGYNEGTLVAFSLCSDEVNRPLEDVFYGWYGEHFNMGGLAGFPFAGVTGFGAMAAHIPDGGSCLLVYGPHVGIDIDGNVGKINRKGKTKSGSCCGSAVAASKYITAVYKGNAEIVGPASPDSIDLQQNYVSAALLPYGEVVSNARDPMVELPFATYGPIDEMMNKIVAKAGRSVGDGKIAFLGGIQINTPRGMSDYFLPLRFDIRDSQSNIIEDLMWVRKPGSEARRKVTA